MTRFVVLPVALGLAVAAPAAAQVEAPPTSALERLAEVQRAAATDSAAVSAGIREAASYGAEARAEAAAVNPYLEWQSEGLGPERRPNAQDSLRIGTPFNFLGQIGPARELVEVAERESLRLQTARRQSTAVEASRRWLELAAAGERITLRRARLERLNAALSILKARHELGEIAGIEVAQLNLEYVSIVAELEALEGELAALSHAVGELCGPDFPMPGRGDLEEILGHSASPPAARLEPAALTAGTAMAIAGAEADIELARARMASVVAWGRPAIEAEWEHFPAVEGAERYDAWGFLVNVPLPLGSVGKRERAAARERSAAAEAARQAALEESVRSARAALATAEGAEARLLSLNPVLDELEVIEQALSAQYRLGAINYLEYVFGTTRHDDLVLAAVDARLTLALSRLELARLLADPALFPIAVLSTEEAS